ncbi:hypothetical protein GBA52_026146 [Prunus armeniaca]|nr:hypothetical protein GBA52_026146 [Prunus armeniaca]
MDYCFSVNMRGLGGRLALLWNKNWTVTILSHSLAHIHAIIVKAPYGFSCRVTGFYENPVTNQRHHSWELLRSLSQVGVRVPGFAVVILMKFWKIKSSLVVDSELCLKWWTFDMLWRTVICWLFKVYKFTWDNGRVGIENVKPSLIVLWQIRDYGKLVPI